MKFNKLFLLAPVAVLSMSSCAIIRKRIPIENYIIKYKDNKEGAHDAKPLDDDGDFNILQLSDLHMSVLDDTQTHYAFIQKTIDEAKRILENEETIGTKKHRDLHLIVISGDIFTFSDRNTVKELCNFFEKQKIPWTLTFGNHDEQGYYPIDWLTGYLTNLSKQYSANLLFRDYPNDDVFGNSNFVIDLGYEGTQPPRQIVMLDSNRYNYGESYGYDYIHGDQIDWYLRAHQEILNTYSTKVEEATPNSLAFFHIPVPEYLDAYKDASNPEKGNSVFLNGGQYTYENGEWENKGTITRDSHNDTSEGSPDVNTGFYSIVQEIGYTKGFFVGHAHTNSNCMDYKTKANQDNSVALCYGIKSTDRVYSDENLLGGQLIRYHSTQNTDDQPWENAASNWFDLDIITHKYADLKEDK